MFFEYDNPQNQKNIKIKSIVHHTVIFSTFFSRYHCLHEPLKKTMYFTTWMVIMFNGSDPDTVLDTCMQWISIRTD